MPPHTSSHPLRVLLVEASEADAELVLHALHQGWPHSVAERVDSEEAFTRALREFEPDIVLCDHAIALFDSCAALHRLQMDRPTIPLIVVAGGVNEQASVAVMRAGAENVVLKSNLSRLVPAIDVALEVRRPLTMLSPRQMEVLMLVVAGLRTREIASRLGISAKTVESHRTAVFRRLDIHDLVGLVRYAVRVGLVAR